MSRVVPPGLLCLVLAIAAAPLPARAAQADAKNDHLSIEEVIDCVLKSLPPSAHGTFVLDWRSAKGEERKVTGQYWSEQPTDSGRRVIVASSPGGTGPHAAYLFSEGDAVGEAWLWTPEQAAAQRVAVRGAAGEMFGTDVSFEDFARFARINFPGQLRRLPDATLDGRAVYVVETRPAPDAGSEYSQIVSSLDKELCVVLRREGYEAGFESGAKPSKILTVDPKDVKREGGYGRATKALLDDRRDGSQTRLELVDLNLDAKLAGSFFTPENLPKTAK
ncbi:MAG: outer membrane lipoprotein-sorting protein [Myxococcota bacterium]